MRNGMFQNKIQRKPASSSADTASACSVCVRVSVCTSVCSVCVRVSVCTSVCSVCERVSVCTSVCSVCVRVRVPEQNTA